jgi:hypothetical protein
MLRFTVSWPACLGCQVLNLGPTTRFLLLSHSCGFTDVGHHTEREQVYNLVTIAAAGPCQLSYFQVLALQDYILLSHI